MHILGFNASPPLWAILLLVAIETMLQFAERMKAKR